VYDYDYIMCVVVAVSAAAVSISRRYNVRLCIILVLFRKILSLYSLILYDGVAYIIYKDPVRENDPIMLVYKYMSDPTGLTYFVDMLVFLK